MLNAADKLIVKEQKEQHVKEIHKKSLGYITIASINDGKFTQKHYKNKDLIKIIIGDKNFYFSQNTFYSTYRRIEYIKELSTLFMDIDYYNTGYRKEAVLYFLETELYKAKIPIPTLVIDSGRGLYLIWKIKAVPAGALPLFNALQKNFYEKLKEYGADKKALDCTRLLRIAGTWNTKAGKMVVIIEHNGFEYDIHDLKNEYLPDLPDKKTNTGLHKKGRPTKAVRGFTESTLYYARIIDICVLCELREWDLKGHRELILFLYRYWNCCFLNDPEDALRQALELNSMFNNSLPKREVVRATRSAERCYLSGDKQYKYKNETLIDLLDISEDEQRQMGSIIGRKEKYRRNNDRRTPKNQNGLTKKQQETSDLEVKAKQLKSKGLKINEIVKELGITRYKVNRLLKR